MHFPFPIATLVFRDPVCYMEQGTEPAKRPDVVNLTSSLIDTLTTAAFHSGKLSMSMISPSHLFVA